MISRPAISRAVVIGSGSAGRRHVAALRRACPDAAITVVRRPDSASPAVVSDPLVTVVSELDKALATEPELAVVASPAPWHRPHTVALLGVGATVLVEKPLAAEVADAATIAGHPAAPSRVVVGYHLRWHETVRTVAHAIASGRIGEPVRFDLSYGQHLSWWRPDIDAAASVTARQELGGGVLLELSHELDGLRFLLGEVTMVSASLGFDGAPTDGLVDTVADLELGMGGGAVGRIHLDMVTAEPYRRWEIRGGAGTLVADLLGGQVELSRPGRDPELIGSASPGHRDRAEWRLVDHVLAVERAVEAPACTASDGLAVVRLVALARDSHSRGEPLEVPPDPPAAPGAGPPPG